MLNPPLTDCDACDRVFPAALASVDPDGHAACPDCAAKLVVLSFAGGAVDMTGWQIDDPGISTFGPIHCDESGAVS